MLLIFPTVARASLKTGVMFWSAKIAKKVSN